MLEDTPRIIETPKLLVPGPEWTPSEKGRHEVLFALDDQHGATISGARIRLRSYFDFPQRAIMAQLEYPQAGRRDHAIDRVDWRPVHTHCNKGRGPEEYRFLELAGTHHHAFHLNWLDSDERLRKENLPIAQPVRADPGSYQELLEFIGECFRISNIAAIEPPPWREEDLFTRLL